MIDRDMSQDLQDIDLHRGNVSILGLGVPKGSEFIRAILIGFRMGLGFGLFMLLIGGVALMWVNVDVETRRWFGLMCVLGGSLLGMAATTTYYLLDCRKGYLKVSDDTISYRTPFKKVTIPLALVFGAGPELRRANSWLRICFLADNPRGFRSILTSFRFHEAESGPVLEEKLVGLDGNGIARLAVISHIRRRLKKNMPVASVPPFRFEATCQHRRSLDAVMDIEIRGHFQCDGRNLDIEEETIQFKSDFFDKQPDAEIKAEMRKPHHHVIPVTNIARVEDNKEPMLNSVTMPNLWIFLKDKENDYIRIYASFYANSREIMKYCQCLPTVFPFYDDNAYWFGGDEYYGYYEPLQSFDGKQAGI